MNLIEPEVLADLSGLSIGLCVVGLLLGLALWLLGWRRHRFWVVPPYSFHPLCIARVSILSASSLSANRSCWGFHFSFCPSRAAMSASRPRVEAW